ncbi:enoyl-CoA hydratase/isomerase family protein [Skermanella sp. TT6]|uniref:Enoyl-CoA hydratase/isomerase family protein n=1 Tax=Skermanella cutis TaxID=2775420 RepID=A0ABX7AZG7_9PROT|nr:enoyl-CoA hydratase [Skermanella sp. TT6]QQP87262.1 enoyl-CoA hydratase/isomerase family protein [Skermanella sp. TT6]
MTDRLIVERQGPIGWITFSNPERHNALKVEMWQALPDALARFEADDEVKVIVLRGAGEKAFISGADISEFEEMRSSEEAVLAYEDLAEGAMRALQTVAKPTIAMIRGYCIGGGLGVAISCDLRIAAEGSTFSIPAGRLGLGYRFSGVKRLHDLVGPAFAKEIFFTARRFPAEEAMRIGLINRMVPAGELDGVIAETCATIADNAPLTVRSVKLMVEELGKPEGEPDHGMCERLVRGCFASEDYVEGRRAFMEKRKPVFRGR